MVTENHSEFKNTIENIALREFLLPCKNKLTAIPTNNTFGAFPFNNDCFDDQSLEVKLKIATSIVRQANKVNYYPTEKDEAVISGDCTTTSKTLIEYCHKLDIPGDYRLISIKKRPIDGDWKKSSRHVAVLHINENGICRTLDPTSMVGYGYGTVSGEGVLKGDKIIESQGDAVYQDVVILNSDEVEIIEDINTLRSYFASDLIIDENFLSSIKSKVETIGNNSEHMSSWLAEFYYIGAILAQRRGDTNAYRQLIHNAVILDPLKIKVLGNNDLPEADKDTVLSTLNLYQEQTVKLVKVWKNKARVLFGNGDDESYQKGIRFIQQIQSELYHAGLLKNEIPEVNINGTMVPMWNINPRLLSENDLCSVWIKPCSYQLGVNNAALETIKKAGEVMWGYGINPTEVLNGSGFIPMLGSHPYARNKDNFDTYNGYMDILLVKGKPEVVHSLKRDFRKDWGRFLKIKPTQKIRWCDGSEIKWSEHLTNYIHSTDSAAETNLHLLLAYPHLSLVNRWDYPHPNL